MNFFKNCSRHVEVVHNENLSIVVFPKPPPHNEISEAFKANFLEQVDRTSVNSKLKGLQDAEIKNRQSDYPYGFLLFFSIIGLTVVDFILYINTIVPFTQNFNFHLFYRIYGVSTVEEALASTFLSLILLFSLIFFVLEMKGAEYLRLAFEKIVSNPKLNCFQKFVEEVYLCFTNLSYFHYLWIFIFGILACFCPFFDSIILIMELYRRSETFSSIIKAIVSSIDQLMVVLLLTLVCTYILTSILYYYNGVDNYPTECSTLYYCFVFSLDNGFRADAGLVGYTDD